MKPFLKLIVPLLMLGINFTANAVPKKPEPCGNVVTVNGQATVKTKPLVAGAPIFPNDEVITAENSSIKFLMIDKSIIDLGASTSFKFDDYRDGENESRQADLSLQFGTVRASVTKKLDEKSKFHIRTKSSVLAVRGTEFLAKWESRDGKVTEQVTVGLGRVEMNTGGQMLALNPGNQYNASGNFQKKEQGGSTANSGTTAEDKPVLKGAVVTLAPEKLTETLKEAKTEDKTFTETVTFEKRSNKDSKKKEEKTGSEDQKEKTPEKTEVAKEVKVDTKVSKEENKIKPDEKKTDSNGTLGAVFQGVTGERLDGKAIVIAKAPDSNNNTNAANGPIRAPASDTDKSDPKGDGPKLPPNFFDPNRPQTYIPGNITGNGTTAPAATTPGQVSQTINITVKVDGIK